MPTKSVEFKFSCFFCSWYYSWLRKFNRQPECKYLPLNWMKWPLMPVFLRWNPSQCLLSFATSWSLQALIDKLGWHQHLHSALNFSPWLHINYFFDSRSSEIENPVGGLGKCAEVPNMSLCSLLCYAMSGILNALCLSKLNAWVGLGIVAYGSRSVTTWQNLVYWK